MVWVQSVTWAAMVGCPCDWWWLVGVVLFTLTFDSSPIKGEGDSVGVVLFTRVAQPPCGFPPTRNELAPRSYPAGTQRGVSPPLWIADQVRDDGHDSLIPDQVRNDGEGEVGFDLFTLAFDSSPIKGEGVYGWCCRLCLVMAKSWFCSPFR